MIAPDKFLQGLAGIREQSDRKDIGPLHRFPEARHSLLVSAHPSAAPEVRKFAREERILPGRHRVDERAVRGSHAALADESVLPSVVVRRDEERGGGVGAFALADGADSEFPSRHSEDQCGMRKAPPAKGTEDLVKLGEEHPPACCWGPPNEGVRRSNQDVRREEFRPQIGAQTFGQGLQEHRRQGQRWP